MSRGLFGEKVLKEAKGWTGGEFRTKADSLNEKDRTLEATISTDAIDRDGEVILPSAFEKRIGSFKSNPVLLWNHNPFEPPIGKAESIEIGEKGMDAVFRFFPEGKNPQADVIFEGFKAEILTSFSIGFRVFDMDPGKPADPEKGTKATPPTVTDAELLEVSAVTIPANTEAIAKFAKAADLFRAAHFIDPQDTKTKDVKFWTPSDLDILTKAVELARARRLLIAKGEWVNEQERAAIDALRLALLAHTPNEDTSDLAVLEALGECRELLEA